MGDPVPDRDVEALIQGYLEGDLSPIEAERLHAALRANPGWSKVLLDHLRDHQALGEVIREAETGAQASRPRLRAASLRAVPSRAPWLAAAAAAVVVAGAAVWLAAGGSRPGTAGAPAAPELARPGAGRQRPDALDPERPRASVTAETPILPPAALPPTAPERNLARVEPDRKAVEDGMAQTVPTTRREPERAPEGPVRALPETAQDGPPAPVPAASATVRTGPPAPATETVVARLEKVEDAVWLLAVAGGRSEARPGAALLADQGIETSGERSRAVVVFPDRTRLVLAPGSRLRLPAPGGAELANGALDADVSRQTAGHPFVIRTPLGAVRVLGTRFSLAASPDAMRVEVQEGSVAVTRREDGETVTVPAGHHVVVARGLPLAAKRPAPFQPPTGRVLFVDASARSRGTGAPDAPFRSLQEALQAAAPGTCVLVRDGVYREPLVTVRGGDGESRRIVIRAEHPRRAVVASPDGALRIAHPWIAVEGLAIDGESGPSDAVVVDTAGDHAVLRDLEVRNAGRDGIDLRSPRDVLVEGCWIHDIYAAPPHAAHGIVTFAVAGLTVRDTEVHHCSGSGILLLQEGDDPRPSWDAVTIERCAVWTAPLVQPRPGIPAGVAPGVAAVVAQRGPGALPGRLTIRASRLHGWGGTAGTGEAAVRLRGTVNALLDGNRVYDNAVGVWIDNGGAAGLRPAVSLTAAGNVFHGNGTAVLCDGPVELTGLFWNNTFGLGHRQALRFGAPPARAEFLNNLFVGADVPVEARGPSNLRVPGEAVASAREHDYRPAAGSPAVGAGVDIPQAGRDVRGVPRPPGARPDVGALQLAPKERRP